MLNQPSQTKVATEDHSLSMAQGLASCVCYLALLTSEGDLAAVRLMQDVQQILKDSGQPWTLEDCRFVNDCVQSERLEVARIKHEQRLSLTEEEAKLLLRRALA